MIPTNPSMVLLPNLLLDLPLLDILGLLLSVACGLAASISGLARKEGLFPLTPCQPRHKRIKELPLVV